MILPKVGLKVVKAEKSIKSILLTNLRPIDSSILMKTQTKTKQNQNKTKKFRKHIRIFFKN